MKFTLKNIFKKRINASTPVLLVAYRILPQEKMIVELYKGQLTMDNVIPYKMHLANDPNYDTSYTMFGDLRKCIIDSLVNDVDQYISFIKENDKLIMDKGKHVGIMNTPNHQFFIKAFKDRFDDELQNQGMFTNIKDGLKFINREDIEEKIDDLFKELKKELRTFR